MGLVAACMGERERVSSQERKFRKSHRGSTAADPAGTASHTRRCVMKRVLFSALVVCLALVATAQVQGQEPPDFLERYASMKNTMTELP